MKQAAATKAKSKAARKPGGPGPKAGSQPTPTKKPPVPLPKLDKIYYGPDRNEIITALQRKHPGFLFRIGETRLGDPDFRSEYPKMEILAQYRPKLTEKFARFAVYGGKA